MIRRLTAYFISCYMLIGSVLLPVGDFSLMKDLPQMYLSYQKIAAPDEIGVIDFVGDYLLGGKVIFGNNKNDNPEKADSNVRFQHAANFCSILNSPSQLISISAPQAVTARFILAAVAATSQFHNELFRPPLYKPFNYLSV